MLARRERACLAGESIHLASAEEQSCWPGGNQVLLTCTGDVTQAMAAGGSVTLRCGLKVQTLASGKSPWMPVVESAPVWIAEVSWELGHSGHLTSGSQCIRGFPTSDCFLNITACVFCLPFTKNVLPQNSKFFNHFSCCNGHLFVAKNVLLSPQFRKVKPRSFLISFFEFLPHHYLKLHSCLSQNSFIFCWLPQNLLYGKREKHCHFETNNAFPYPIGEKLRTNIFFVAMNTERVHNIDFLSLEAEMVQTVWSYWIAINWPPFCFCHGSRWTKAHRGPKKVDLLVWG